MITRSRKRKGDIFVELSLVPKKRKSKPHVITKNIVDRSLELTDPTPNLQHLFASLDTGHFAGLLTKNHVEVKWVTTDVNYTGICFTYEPREQTDEKRIVIELNEQLLKFRTRRDLVETLLHEMIHAFLSIKDSCDDHGPNFLKEMDRINAETGATVSIHHNHHNEVALYNNRLWRCNGICRKRSPQFGLIRIETGSLVDFEDQWWWSYHLKNCGGNFELVPVPEVHRVHLAQQNQFLQVAVTEPVERNANAQKPNADTVTDSNGTPKKTRVENASTMMWLGS
ncbi:sprT-like domain-containing protein Spartan [Bradysia coprophila]|uniref:sprT-like domain-containing protein Spartan n=1 Tax=Bradysia coprophila TaxID=38358 RepID=UPI00187DCA33|nr:sprT-like domain-containing protein Spartan [Bradysia coprophila]